MRHLFYISIDSVSHNKNIIRQAMPANIDNNFVQIFIIIFYGPLIITVLRQVWDCPAVYIYVQLGVARYFVHVLRRSFTVLDT